MSNGKNTITEIAELLSNPNVINTDVQDAFGLMREHLHNKYTGRMMNTVETYRRNADKNPSDEVRLLKAFKPFIPDSGHERLETLIDTLQTYNTFLKIRDEFGFAAQSSDANAGVYSQSAPEHKQNESVHSDGVYDIDENCYINSYGGGFGNMAGIMMMMSFMNGGK